MSVETKRVRDHVWSILNDAEDARYRWFHHFINTLILVSVLLVVFDLLGEVPPTWKPGLNTLDEVILWIFLAEFVARVLVIRNWLPRSVKLGARGKLKAFLLSRLRFLLSPWGLIDFVALLPLFPGLVSLRILRLLRLARSIQFFRYASPLRTLTVAFRDNALLFTVAMGFVLASIVLSALMFFIAEFEANDNVNTFGDTLWWSIVTVTTVGFGDITPVTGGGKVIGAALMLSGMFIIAMFAGVISSTLVGHLMPLRLEQVRMSSIADHIVIAGWNSGVPTMLQEMEREYGAELPPIIVFAPRPRPDNLDERYVYVQGDFRREGEYDKVRLAFARTVVVVADSEDGTSPPVRDASTVLTVFTIRSFEAKLKSVQRTDPIHMVAEILDSENREHAIVAGADEIIETSRLGASLLAHTAGNPGVGSVITNLVLASRNNVYAAALPASFIEGKVLTFSELQDRARDELGILVVGVVHQDEMELNPASGHTVFAADRMVYIGPKRL